MPVVMGPPGEHALQRLVLHGVQPQKMQNCAFCREESCVLSGSHSLREVGRRQDAQALHEREGRQIRNNLPRPLHT
jgi:hypothetical protein